MALTHKIRRKRVLVPHEPDEPADYVSVRGLAPSELAAVMHEDGGAALAGVYQTLVSGPDAVTNEAVSELLVRLLVDIPEIMARIIARAADDKDSWEVVLTMPTGLQLELLYGIGELTFASDMVLKKAMEVAQKFAATGNPSGLLSGLKTGSGASASK